MSTKLTSQQETSPTLTPLVSVEMQNYLQHPENCRLVRLPEVLKLIPVSRSTWWAWCASGKAPPPIKLSERTTCWRLADIISFINEMAEQGVKS